MKINQLITLLTLSFIGVFALAHSALALDAKSEKIERPVRLQVQVDLPFSRNIIYDDDIEEAFAHRVITALYEQGFKGRIKFVEQGETVTDAIPVLNLNVFEWRVNRAGDTSCVFSAKLASPRGKKDLGMFSGTSMMLWMRRDWFARADSFEEAASDALSHLKARLDASGLLEPAALAKK